MKIEVGKYYLNRDGRCIYICRKTASDTYCFAGKPGELYTENGKWSIYDEAHGEDLVSEYKPTEIKSDKFTIKTVEIIEWNGKDIKDIMPASYIFSDDWHEMFQFLLNFYKENKK